MISRRLFTRLALGSLAALATPSVNAFAAAKPKVVILGGGAGGATAALMLRRFTGDRFDITLVEQNPVYVTCFFSNWVLADLRSMDDITHRYDRLTETGIRIVTARADAIDRDAKAIVLTDGTAIPYDRLILSPGIDLDYAAIAGYGEAEAAIAPHAWHAGPQTVQLRDRLHALVDGQQIVITVPDNPYRCPPGPYERASLFAHVLKSKGFTRSTITILDAKEKFSKQALFQEGWEKHYPGMIQWLPASIHGGVSAVNTTAGTVTTSLDEFQGDLLNIIPPQRAGAIALKAGLAGDAHWCPVKPESMMSALDPSIYIIGDSANAGEMPKSAFAANNQAKVAVMNVLADLVGRERPDPRFFNTCWSLITPDDGVKVGASYQVKDGKIVARTPFVSQPGESADIRARSVAEAAAWYKAAIGDMFGI